MEARLALRFDKTGEGTRVRVIRQEPPWKVIRGFTTATGECLVHLGNVSGGVLGGDRLYLEIEAAPDAQVQITTTGATRIYAPRPNAPASLCSANIRLHEGALLEFLPDPVIPFCGARAQQSMHIEIGQSATLFWWETIAPGRLASGECFQYEFLRLLTEIRAGSRPILIDRMRLEPRVRSPLSPVRFARMQFLTSFVIAQAGARPTVWRELETQLANGVGWGVSALAADGVLVRGLSDSGITIASSLNTLWRSAKLLLCGRPVAPPRKTY